MCFQFNSSEFPSGLPDRDVTAIYLPSVIYREPRSPPELEREVTERIKRLGATTLRRGATKRYKVGTKRMGGAARAAPPKVQALHCTRKLSSGVRSCALT